MSDSAPTTADTRRLARDARDRVRFEEEALELSDQVYRVARRFVGTREEAEDLVQQPYARAFRSWRQYTPGTNLRAWLLRILANVTFARGRRQPRAPGASRRGSGGRPTSCCTSSTRLLRHRCGAGRRRRSARPCGAFPTSRR